jgi:phosphoglycerate dehydrogenase-like enzyme
MTLVIASQMEEAFNAALAEHPVRPRIIAASPEEPWQSAGEADVLLVRPTPVWRARKDTVAPPQWPGRLRWVFSASTGVDVYPHWLFDAPLVTCGRGTSADEIADYVIAAIYAHTKNLPGATVHSRAEWLPQSLGRVAGSTVGIVGLGAIGEAVAQRALALGTRVVAVRRSDAGTSVAGVELLSSVEAVVAVADHIVAAVPATPRTWHLFDAALFAKAKPGAHFINIARGSVVDQEALIEALDSGRLDFATLDVTDPEPLTEGHALYTHPRVRITPHISSNHLLLRDRLLDKVRDAISLFARGETPPDVVDRVRGY